MESTKKSLPGNVEDIAVRTGVFSFVEIAILREVIENYASNPDKDYSLVTVEEGLTLNGFILFGKTPLTECGWDLYWLAVDPSCQGKGVGLKLMQQFEECLKKKCPEFAVVRIETSSRPEYESARKLYLRSGFHLAGQIDNFYSHGDHLMMYSKEIN